MRSSTTLFSIAPPSLSRVSCEGRERPQSALPQITIGRRLAPPTNKVASLWPCARLQQLALVAHSPFVTDPDHSPDCLFCGSPPSLRIPSSPTGPRSDDAQLSDRGADTSSKRQSAAAVMSERRARRCVRSKCTSSPDRAVVTHSSPLPRRVRVASDAKTLSLTAWSRWLCGGIRGALSLAISRSWRLAAVSRKQNQRLRCNCTVPPQFTREARANSIRGWLRSRCLDQPNIHASKPERLVFFADGLLAETRLRLALPAARPVPWNDEIRERAAM